MVNIYCLLFIVTLFMKRILNESKEGWKIVEEETNPCALITLMVSWIDCLMVRYIILNNTMQYNNFS